MAALLKQSKRADHQSRLIVAGYIREIQHTVSNWVVPEVIIDFCVAFYFLQILWDLSGMDYDEEDSKIVTKLDNSWINIPINQEISKRMCNRFELEVTVNKVRSQIRNHFFIGFLKVYSNKMRRISTSIQFRRNEVKFQGVVQNSILPRNLHDGDRVKMIINFEDNHCEWYWNDLKDPLVTTSVDVGTVIPTISLFHEGSEFEITSFEFE